MHFLRDFAVNCRLAILLSHEDTQLAILPVLLGEICLTTEAVHLGGLWHLKLLVKVNRLAKLLNNFMLRRRNSILTRCRLLMR